MLVHVAVEILFRAEASKHLFSHMFLWSVHELIVSLILNIINLRSSPEHSILSTAINIAAIHHVKSLLTIRNQSSSLIFIRISNSLEIRLNSVDKIHPIKISGKVKLLSFLQYTIQSMLNTFLNLLFLHQGHALLDEFLGVDPLSIEYLVQDQLLILSLEK